MINFSTNSSFNITQMLFNICGEELAEIMSCDTPSERINEVIEKIEAKTGFRIGDVLREVEGNLLTQ